MALTITGKIMRSDQAAAQDVRRSGADCPELAAPAHGRLGVQARPGLAVLPQQPGFAEAVADWLDAEAERVEKLGVGARLLHSLGPGPAAVARAYLGSEENDGA